MREHLVQRFGASQIGGEDPYDKVVNTGSCDIYGNGEVRGLMHFTDLVIRPIMYR